MNTTLGKPLSRLDGLAKVTGAAHYAADLPVRAVARAVMACATIPAGELVAIDLASAANAPGVLKIFTHHDTPAFPELTCPPAGQKHLPLQGSTIRYEGEPIALVVAKTFEQATYAASLIRATYRNASFETDFLKLSDRREEGNGFFPNDTRVGRIEDELSASPVIVTATYHTADRHHHAIEPSTTLAEWRDGKLYQSDSTQGVQATRTVLAQAFGLRPEDVRVTSQFVGGGFGCKGWTWPHQILCAMAARDLQQPVQLTLPRAQTFTAHGYQPATEQTLTLGAERDGTIKAIRHSSLNPSAVDDDYVETCATTSRSLYAAAAIETKTRIVRVNRGVPTPMRAPQEGPGLVGLECAMDELAYALSIDPLALRLKNYAEKNPSDGRPFSAKKLRECYSEGASRFGWSHRKMTPRSSVEGNDLIGWGMATAMMMTVRSPTVARVTLIRDGSVLVESSTQEIGTGTSTVIPQIAADALGLPISRVRLRWGDTSLPVGPMTAGSATTISVGSAVLEAAKELKAKIAALAPETPPLPEHYEQLLARHGLPSLSAEFSWTAGPGADSFGQPREFALCSFGAVFVEVRVDRDFMIPRVTRGVGVFNAGRIINPKTARSQLLGGFAWGLGQALLEKTIIDHSLGRYLSKNLSGNLIPVNGDLPLDLDVSFIEEPDYQASATGARGIGELSACGTGPAIANAIFHATGTRVRKLPVRPEDLLP